MDNITTTKLLEENNQNHILRFWDSYNDDQKKNIISQIKSIDFSLLNKLYQQSEFYGMKYLFC